MPNAQDMLSGIVLLDKWLSNQFPDERDEVMGLFLEAGWQIYHGQIMPSEEMLDEIATKKRDLLSN